jgi:hypothetical protein
MTDAWPAGRRVLLDEMLPRMLARELPGHHVTTVAQEGWSGILNGELLRRMEAAEIEVFLTADRKMEHQQRLSGRTFGVIVLSAGGTKLEDLKPMADVLRDAVARVQPGGVLHVGR